MAVVFTILIGAEAVQFFLANPVVGCVAVVPYGGVGYVFLPGTRDGIPLGGVGREAPLAAASAAASALRRVMASSRL